MADVPSLCVRGFHGTFTADDLLLIDHRFLLIPKDSPPQFSCPIAMEAVIRFLRKVDPYKLDSEALRAIKMKQNRSAQGFVVEEVVNALIREKGANGIDQTVKGAFKVQGF